MQRAAGITPEISHSLQLDRLEEFVRQILGKNDEFVALLAALLSIPTGARYAPLELTPQQQKNRTFAAVLTLLEAQTKQQPVLLVFEDAHWIDPTSFELLKRIRDRIAHWRMLALKRLGRQDVTAMIDSMNAEASLPPTVIEQIIAKAEGLPLFVEEITNAVAEDANRKLTEGQQSLDVQSTFVVPATLHESLMARLNLAAPMKTVAQIASVIGREFSLKLLNAVAKLPERSVRAAVDRLLQSGLLVQTSESNSQTFSLNMRWYRTKPTPACYARTGGQFISGRLRRSAAILPTLQRLHQKSLRTTIPRPAGSCLRSTTGRGPVD